MALDVIDKYRNHNVPYETSEMTFWPQILNKTANFYQSTPNNLFGVMKLPDYLPQKTLEELLKLFHLYDLEKVFEKLIKERYRFICFKQAYNVLVEADENISEFSENIF